MSSSKPPPQCPSCKVEVGLRPANAHFPFCSDRCRLIDLGKWLGGEYRIPQRPEEDEDGELPPPLETE
jgi:endogenous inhibitor of DNA gyrase (YacG/DUF329 family)